MTQMLEDAERRMHRAVTVEMDGPLSWVALLKKKVQHPVAPPFLIEATTGAPVISEPASEVPAPRQCRFNRRPRQEGNPHPAFSVDIRYLFHEMPKMLGMQATENQEHGVLLISWPGIESSSISGRLPETGKLSRQ